MFSFFDALRVVVFIKRFKNEKGEVMIESLIVYSITIFLLFFILAVFSVLFQRWNIQTVANESATRVAQTYKLSKADTLTGEVTKDQITGVREYRYIFKNSELKNAAQKKIADYAKDRLAKTTYTKNVTDPKVDVVVKSDALSRRHIEVTIKGEYSVPFGDALSYFGFDSTTKYTTVAYAECIDMIDYVNTVDFAENQASLGMFDSSFVNLVDKILKLFDHILN